MSIIVKLFWLVSLAGAGLGAVTLFDLLRAQSAPQQAAIAAMAAALAIVPYVWARALEALVHTRQRTDDLAAIRAKLATMPDTRP